MSRISPNKRIQQSLTSYFSNSPQKRKRDDDEGLPQDHDVKPAEDFQQSSLSTNYLDELVNSSQVSWKRRRVNAQTSEGPDSDLEAPLCHGHRLPCLLKTVHKQNENFGLPPAPFVCSLPWLRVFNLQM